MHLNRLEIFNFRCLKKIELTFDHLTVLIGENDAGKSSILDLLEICLNNERVDSRDFYQDDSGNVAPEFEAIIEFQLDRDDTEASEYALNGQLRVRYVFSDEGSTRERYYWSKVPKDQRLQQDFKRLKADEQRNLIQALSPDTDIQKLSNASKRDTWLSDYRDRAEKTEQWVPTDSRWGQFLPRFERYSSLDYSSPERMIERTLRQVYERTIYKDILLPDGGRQRQLIDSLKEIEKLAIKRIQKEVTKLIGHIKKYHRSVSEVGYEPVFDHSNSFRGGEFRVNTGRGLHALSRTGAGTRRRMLMGVLEWDREVNIKQAQSQEHLPAIIRGYDEPDTNLHYGAQRRMFQVITDIVNAENSRVQAVLCTHSLTMIDRAAAQSIRLLQLCEEGHTKISKLDIDDDPEIEHFLSNLARELGITNTLIFYERCFILIEGQTEENALPVLYRKLYQRSLLEDGIRIINVHGNGAVRPFLQLLRRNRKELTIVFIDKDTKTQKASKLTENELRSAGFDNTFIKERVIYVGDKEFEDIFADHVIAGCLQEHWPKSDNSRWEEKDIAILRTRNKFSEEISRAAWEATKSPCRKPDFGQRLAEHCCVEDMPAEILSLFELARTVAKANM